MKRIVIYSLLVLTSLGSSKAGTSSADHVYTLYRGGAVEKSVRIIFAYFETIGENDTWNQENCELVAKLLNKEQKLQTMPVKFWCEKGRSKQ